MLFFDIDFDIFFGRSWLHFGVQKSPPNCYFSKKLKFEGVLWSTIALELLFKWILKPSELDFGGFLSPQKVFFGSCIEFTEAYV